MTLDQAISQSIQDWLLEQADPNAKALAQDLNNMMILDRTPDTDALIRRFPRANVESLVLQGWVGILSGSVQNALEHFGENMP